MSRAGRNYNTVKGINQYNLRIIMWLLIEIIMVEWY
jgi:hypothetical protein